MLQDSSPVTSFFFWTLKNSWEYILYVSQVEKSVYIRCTQLGSRVISVRVVYNVEVKIASNDALPPVSCTCYEEQCVSLHTILPFDVSIHLSSLKVINESSIMLSVVIIKQNMYRTVYMGNSMITHVTFLRYWANWLMP